VTSAYSGDREAREDGLEVQMESGTGIDGGQPPERGRLREQVARLEVQDLVLLVAGLLRAMGYAIQASAAGLEEAEELLATPATGGAQTPRTRVRLVHRPATPADAADIRGFVGERQPGERGWYVSTGGFRDDARDAVTRAEEMRLLDLSELASELVEYYDRLDPSTRALLD